MKRLTLDIKIMNELQLKANVLAYCRRNGKITLDDVIKMSIPRNVFAELINENQLVEVKNGVYKIKNKYESKN